MLDSFHKDIVYCTYCPKLCRFACPVTNAEARETVTPTTKLNLLQLARQGSIELDAEVAEIMYHCAGCLTCRAYCKHRIDVPAVIERARAEAMERGVAPESLQRHVKTFKEHNNPYGKALKKKLEDLDLEDYMDKAAPVVYFVGCTTLFHDPGQVAAVVKLLRAADLDFTIYTHEDALCCGTPALLSGAHGDFRLAARAVAKKLDGCKTIVSGCPSCLATFKFKYPAVAGVELNARVMHTTELAAQLLKKGRLEIKQPIAARAMYHDPCHLAKYFGVVEPPRRIMEAVFEPEGLVEFSWNKDKNYCCGGGGLLPVTNLKLSRAITRKRLEEFYEADAEMLVTACPTCERTFHRADPYLKVSNLIVLLSESL